MGTKIVSSSQLNIDLLQKISFFETNFSSGKYNSFEVIFDY